MSALDAIIHKAYKPIKAVLPDCISNPIRSFFTAILTPIMFSIDSGHFLSSFRRAAVDKKGEPLPWYSYPCIDFLKSRTYEGKRILEFGGGQSTVWWSSRAEFVVTFEADKDWVNKLSDLNIPNLALHQVSIDNPSDLLNQIRKICRNGAYRPFDVVIIDGLWWRKALIPVAIEMVSETGVIVCDNADQEDFGFYKGFLESGLKRVDFVGIAPGTLSPECTSIYFSKDAFLFHARNPIPVV